MIAMQKSILYVRVKLSASRMQSTQFVLPRSVLYLAEEAIQAQHFSLFIKSIYDDATVNCNAQTVELCKGLQTHEC